MHWPRGERRRPQGDGCATNCPLCFVNWRDCAKIGNSGGQLNRIATCLPGHFTPRSSKKVDPLLGVHASTLVIGALAGALPAHLQSVCANAVVL